MNRSVVEDRRYRDELARVNAPRYINSTGIPSVGPVLMEPGTD
jgi:hypothetical protein